MSAERIARVGHDPAKEARRRLIVGLSGLTVMLLLVLLAGWLTQSARRDADLARAQAQAAGVSNPGSDPQAQENSSLVDLGVAPSLDQGPQSAVPSAQPPQSQVKGGALVVPDLQPDPQLDRPKDRR